MPFVVKLTSRIGGVCWLSAPNAEGFRTFATREMPAVSAIRRREPGDPKIAGGVQRDWPHILGRTDGLNSRMPFVVKGTRRDFGVNWSWPSTAGSSTFGARKGATVFPTQAEAQAAADKASKSYSGLGITFTVEAAE
jgi:hypothetical protein